MKKMKNLISLIIILIFSQSIDAQETAKNSLALGYGTSYLMRQDLIFSEFIHKDLSPVFASLTYEKEKNFIHKVELDFGMYKYQMIDTYEFFWEAGVSDHSYPHTYTFVDLNYYIGKNHRFSDKLSLNYGLASVNKIQPGSYIWGFSDIFGYFANFGLDAWAETEYSLNEKSRVKGKISFPLVSWSTRSPYLVNDAEHLENTISNKFIPTFFAYVADGKIRSWNKLQSIDLEFSYDYDLSSKFSLGAEYGFEFIAYSDPTKLTSFRNTLQLIFKYKF